MKKKWEKPVLIILDNTKPEESILIPCVNLGMLNMCIRAGGPSSRDIR